MTTNTGYELDVELFELYMLALRYKCKEEGVLLSDLAGVFEVMRRWWFIMSDEPTVQAYVDGVHSVDLAAKKAAHEAAIAAIETELGA